MVVLPSYPLPIRIFFSVMPLVTDLTDTDEWDHMLITMAMMVALLL